MNDLESKTSRLQSLRSGRLSGVRQFEIIIAERLRGVRNDKKAGCSFASPTLASPLSGFATLPTSPPPLPPTTASTALVRGTF